MEKGSSSSSSSSSFSSGGGADSINGLKIYLEGAGSGLHPAPAKRGRTGVAARCQVEGCSVDLSDAKAYYCRHKVCGMHSKYPKVIVGGIEQRFCQQCSRFHQLPEFDQGKRSCRRRLAGHNERRRKPTPPPGTFLPSPFDNHSEAGGFVMDFNGYSTTVTGRDSWPITTSGRGLGDQVTIAQKYELSWPRTSQNSLPDNLLPDPASQSGIHSEGCFNGASNSIIGALSLLSNESWSSRNQRALGLGLSSFLGTDMVQLSVNNPIGQFSYAPWGFKDNQTGNSINETALDMDLSVISNQPSNGAFSRDLELAQPSDRRYTGESEPSRGYDSPVHNMHWSL